MIVAYGYTTRRGIEMQKQFKLKDTAPIASRLREDPKSVVGIIRKLIPKSAHLDWFATLDRRLVIPKRSPLRLMPNRNRSLAE